MSPKGQHTGESPDKPVSQNAENTLVILKKALQARSKEKGTNASNYLVRFDSALQNDMDVPQALTVMVDLAKKIIENPEPSLQKALGEMMKILGLGAHLQRFPPLLGEG